MRTAFENGKKLVVNLELLEMLGGQGHLNEALVLQQIDYWLEVNRKKKENYIDGEYWFYSSLQKMHERDFKHCFSLETLKRAIRTLEQEKYLITIKHGNTKYYRIDYRKIQLKHDKYFNISDGSEKTPAESGKTAILEKNNLILGQNELGQNDPMNVKLTQKLGQNDPMDRVKMTQSLGQNDPTNKDYININNIYIKYNLFIKDILNNIYTDTALYNFWFSEVKQDVKLVISRVLAKQDTSEIHRINGTKLDIASIQQRFNKVAENNINYVTDKILKSKQITNFENYVIASLYNSVKEKSEPTSLGYDWFGKEG